jgi:hypothetical protein
MPLPNIANTIRTSVVIRAANNHITRNVLHFRKDGALSFPAAIAILDPLLLNQYTVANGAGIPWKTIGPAAASIVQFEYTPLDGVSATSVITHASAGTDANTAMPASVALVVTLRTATRGRSFRGRVYTGPYCQDANVGGVPTAATVTGIATQWNRFATITLPGSGVALVVASYHLALATDVTACTADSRWDTQRRRLNA